MQLAPELLRMAEGTSSQFSLALASQPLADVVVGINCDGGDGVELSIDSVRFSPQDWAGRETTRWRAVTITVPPDGRALGTTTFQCNFHILDAVDLTYFTLQCGSPYSRSA
jgi:hypothetical protein